MARPRDGSPDQATPAIHVELWLDGSMPAGVVTAPSGATRQFTGWVALISAVDAIASEPEGRLAGQDD